MTQSLTTWTENLDLAAAGRAMHAWMAELFPICRSITGDGIRATLRRIGERIPLEFSEVPSGTQVFDWTVPPEWNIRDAYIADQYGRRVVDFQRSNLHVLGYSAPIHARMSLAELRPHLFTLPGQPDLIPYRTSYYQERWGFCLSQRQLDQLPDGEYEVHIDSTLAPGSLTYAECVLPGAVDEEVLISCHACHPSLANDNLSGLAVATWLAGLLQGIERRYTYRFLFIPGTIGSITWLARNEARAALVRHGLVLTCVGDPGQATYKRSRRGNAPIDRAVEHVLRCAGAPFEVQDFFPYGYDERQYCSPGFNLPVGCLMRTPHGRFREYHTSADSIEFVRPEALADTLDTLVRTVVVLELNETYVNQNPKCEPQLGRRGLYGSLGGAHDAASLQMALLWVLNLSDGCHSLLDIAERAAMPFALLAHAAALLRRAGLLAPVAQGGMHELKDAHTP
jgi:aminopeptidase-like protein